MFQLIDVLDYFGKPFFESFDGETAFSTFETDFVEEFGGGAGVVDALCVVGVGW